MKPTDSKSHICTIVNHLQQSIPEYDLDNRCVVHFDEIAFMCGKWEGVRNKPLASAISMSNLAGQVVNSANIVIGGESCFSKAAKREAVRFRHSPISSCLGVTKEQKEMIKTINESDYSPNGMLHASEETVKVARDIGMQVIGVNMSAYFTQETFLMAMDSLGKAHSASPSNPMFAIGDNARIHVTPEVRFCKLEVFTT